MALKEKLAALGYDPVEDLVKIAHGAKTLEGPKIVIGSMMMPYLYPRRKSIDDSNVGRVSIDETMSVEEAVGHARDLIAWFDAHAAAQKDRSAPMLEGEPNPLIEEQADES